MGRPSSMCREPPSTWLETDVSEENRSLLLDWVNAAFCTSHPFTLNGSTWMNRFQTPWRKRVWQMLMISFYHRIQKKIVKVVITWEFTVRASRRTLREWQSSRPQTEITK